MITTLIGAERLVLELRECHCEVEGPIDAGGVKFVIVKNQTINYGPFFGKKVSIAIQAPNDFPETPPAGFQVSPRLAPTGAHAVTDGHQPAPSGEWQYWSRQVPRWKSVDPGKQLMRWWKTAFADYGR